MDTQHAYRKLATVNSEHFSLQYMMKCIGNKIRWFCITSMDTVPFCNVLAYVVYLKHAYPQFKSAPIGPTCFFEGKNMLEHYNQIHITTYLKQITSQELRQKGRHGVGTHFQNARGT